MTAVRIVIPVVIEMTAEQAADYAHVNGLPRKGGKLTAGEIKADIRDYVETLMQDSPEFGDGAADVSIKRPAI